MCNPLCGKNQEANVAAESNSDPASDIERRRSLVRRVVTYSVIGVYLALACLVVVWLMWAGRYDLAIGVLGGVAGIAGSITGFWFGTRRPNETGRNESSESSN